MCKEETTFKDIQITTNNVFNTSTVFTNLKLPKGVDLDTVLSKIDYKLGDNVNTVNYNYLSLDYLKSKYTVTTFINFSEAVNEEFSFINNTIKYINERIVQVLEENLAIKEDVQKIKFPRINDSNGLGFTINDTINKVLQVLTDNVGNTITNDSPELITTNTNSINLTATGDKKHNLLANVKISPALNNKVQVLNDGLYVAPTLTTKQNLSVQGNSLSISDGNTVTLPTQGLQTIAINGNDLSISNGNTITLPIINQTPITADNSPSISWGISGTNNHHLNANLKISEGTDNLIGLASDGILVTITANQIIDKIVNANDPTLKAIMCNYFSSCSNTIVFNWYCNNTGSSPVTISYKNEYNVVSTLTLDANTSVTLGAKALFTAPTSTLLITFMGSVQI